MRNALRYNEHVTIGVAPDADDIAQLAVLGYRTLIDLRDPQERFGGAIAEMASRRGLTTVELPVRRSHIEPQDLRQFYRLVLDPARAPFYAFSRMGKKPLAFLLLFDAIVGSQPLSWIFRRAGRLGVDLRGDLPLQQFLVDLYNDDCGAQIVGEFITPDRSETWRDRADDLDEATPPRAFMGDEPVARAERQRLLRQRGLTVWFTGLPAAGKTTTACALERELVGCGYLAYLIDADVVRQGLCRDLGFTPEDRSENIRRASELARVAADIGAIALACFISPYRRDRLAARELHVASGLPFVEVFVDTPLEVCKKRDPKHLYRKAEQGELLAFTGVQDPYEAPVTPELSVRTHQMTPQAIAQQIVRYLSDRALL